MTMIEVAPAMRVDDRTACAVTGGEGTVTVHFVSGAKLDFIGSAPSVAEALLLTEMGPGLWATPNAFLATYCLDGSPTGMLPNGRAYLLTDQAKEAVEAVPHAPASEAKPPPAKTTKRRSRKSAKKG